MNAPRRAQRPKPLVLALVVILGLAVAPLEAGAQDFEASFASELTFQPLPLMLTSAEFTLLVGITVSDAAFFSQTRFDLAAFRSQLFSLRLTLGELLVDDRLLFAPGFAFERNELRASLAMRGFDIAVEALLEELGPPSPDVQPGLVLEAGGRSSLGIGVTSVTGFGVSRVVEDHVTVLPCLPIDLACLGDGFPDTRPDRTVAKPFVFTEQAVRVDIRVGDVTLAATPLFTLAGLTKLLLEADLAFDSPHLRFSSTSTLDGALWLVRQEVAIEVVLAPLGWRATTRFSGAPIAFEDQTFKARLRVSGLSLYTTVVFTSIGFQEFRIGAGISL